MPTATIAVTGASFATMIFMVFVLIFIAHSIVVAYHWLSYGYDRKISLLSVAIYLLICAPLFLTMSIAIRFM